MITFRTNSINEQILVTIKDIGKFYHQIIVNSDKIEIQGVKNGVISSEFIQKDLKSWTTFFLEYQSNQINIKFSYIINNDPIYQGDFIFDSTSIEVSGVSIRSGYKNEKFFKGDISSIEFYHKKEINTIIHSYLKYLLIDNQII